MRFANRAFEALVRRGGLEGITLPEADADLGAAELGELLTGALESGTSFEDFEVVAPQGGRRLVLNGRVVADTGERLVLLAVEDATQRLMVAQKAAELTAELEARVRRRTEELEAFSYSVSHDLRAPLRSIDGFSRILVDEHAADLSPQALDYLGRVRVSAQRMGQLIDGLLAFSRLGRQALSLRPVATPALVADVLEHHADEIASRGVEIVADGLPRVTADELLLRQVFDNLIGNALKYTRQTERPRIEVSATAEQGWTRFAVADNGVGFDAGYAEKAFAVFQRLHRAEDYEGTGIGLALVRRIVDLHGGSVSASAAPGEGATFTFSLPERS